MENCNCKGSSTDACDSILNHIINCANCALKDKDKDKIAFKDAMKDLAHEFRTFFKSEYCAIGTVVDGIAEDSAIDLKISNNEQKAKEQIAELESVRSADANGEDTLVSIALKSKKDIYSFDKNHFSKNYDNYKIILDSEEPENSIVIPLRDVEGKSYGFIQFINANNSIDYEHYIRPYKDALLGLVQIIINNQKNQHELAKKNNLLKDADFYNKMQEKRDNVNELLDSIMDYFSEEFNAAVISFRIPILNGYSKEPLFYLRKCFIHKSINETHRKTLINLYEKKWLIKNKEEMGGFYGLKCINQDKILESESKTDYTEYGFNLEPQTLIMPIFCDFDKKCINSNRQPKIEYCKEEEHQECTDRFKKLHGIFRLRLSKSNLRTGREQTNNHTEIKERLSYLSKQITLLIESIVNKYESESLQTFQNELKKSSFIKMTSFDESCVQIIKNSVHADICSIYRYDKRSRRLNLSATTAATIHFKGINDIEANSNRNKCFISTASPNNVLVKAFKARRTKYIFNILDPKTHDAPFIENSGTILLGRYLSAMIVPMLNKEGECIGVVLLLGKTNHKHSISTAYWEHDIRHIEFIVNIQTRISESDTERLTFLSQLSHELLSPVTELVYDNDLTVNISKRNSDSITKRQLITKLKENIDRNMLFKYIISDTEFIYSSSGKNIDYNIVEQKKPKEILLSAISLLEKEAHAKGITIKKYISEMPPLYLDKERMMQVFLNLLKNAIRYSDNYTTIEIYYKNENKDFHEIRFSNVGIGIQEDETESIFELFRRGREAKNKFVRGTGMGLFIVRNIMRAHGGDCYVRQLKDPTEFVITLPNKSNK